ncbi:MAG: 3-deoxy-7-phosphoheptulonate synthase [Spirochaetales bacterium]|nr:3-deoxy-7-phosphoheptulonate synthase [Spirochaetales bacterium]
MPRTNNINILSKTPLISPEELWKELPLTEETSSLVVDARRKVQDLLHGNSAQKLMVITGPCSIHCIDEAVAYAKKLEKLNEEVSDKILLVMRVYFEKPRTVVGWKGLIYDPDLNGSYDFEKGLRTARQLILEIAGMGLPVATEILDPIITQYIADAVAWAAIGARTTESQTHRQLVSGLSMPTGFKNATNGNIQVAIDAIKAASHNHSFLGVLKDGRTGVFRTKGNPDCHLVLRGGKDYPNYQSEWIAYSAERMRKEGVKPNIIIDCSHANAQGSFLNQIDVMNDIVGQLKSGTKAIKGVMLESNLMCGNQKIAAREELKFGVSITDPCLGWEETEKVIRMTYENL